ncbi:MAG: serine acetyltransferase [Prevotellaceae bacterium]|jgi:serine O-acetyltransferase|nr:serine acetyltransferase [Prevotellaceae bacterium]
MKTGLSETIERLSQADDSTDFFYKYDNKEAMPSVDILKEIISLARSILFPGYFGNSNVNGDTLIYHIGLNIEKLLTLLTGQIKAGLCFEQFDKKSGREDLCKTAKEKAIALLKLLPDIKEQLHTDVIAAYNGDPAAKSPGEIIFCYPGVRAISSYRFANALLRLGVPLIPRIISEMAHSETGIDIHPGATIGNYFTIDHGTGVVIGETTVIGNNVKIYQGVTLGAKSFPLDKDGNPIKGVDRHPKIGNNVIIYSNSTVLGNIKVGDGAIIGGNIWVDVEVPAGARLIQQEKRSE